MSILAECPICHLKQATRNRKCKCGEDLIKAKRSERVYYWIDYRLPSGKQRREPANTTSIEEAKLFESERKVLKKKKPEILQQAASAKISFSELTKWYLKLTSVKNLSSYSREKVVIENFNTVFSQHLVNKITLNDLEIYQDIRKKKGLAPRSIDYETGAALRMLNKAYDNDMLTDANIMKPFKRLKKALKKGSNARKRTLTFAEYQALLNNAPNHLKDIISVAFFTGMRVGEIVGLKWKHIDDKAGFIRLTADDTKESSAKDIPINKHIAEILQNVGKVRHIQHDHVFTYGGQPIKRIVKSFKSCCERARVPYGKKTVNGVTFHDIRRTVKTNMLNAGIDKIIRDVILGHSLNGMDAFYMSPSDDDLKDAMNKYTEWFDKELKLQFVDQTVDQIAK